MPEPCYYGVDFMDVGTRKRGRPPKFRERGRPVTVTLPDATLARLAAIDPDRSRAIVKATDAAFLTGNDGPQLPELVEVAPGLSVILVGPSAALRQIDWLRMMEIAPSRFLLVIPSGTSIDSLELAVIDLLDNLDPSNSWERSVLQRLRELIGKLRRGAEVSKAEVLVIQKRTA
jgi:hypothetical protein